MESCDLRATMNSTRAVVNSQPAGCKVAEPACLPSSLWNIRMPGRTMHQLNRQHSQGDGTRDQATSLQQAVSPLYLCLSLIFLTFNPSSFASSYFYKLWCSEVGTLQSSANSMGYISQYSTSFLCAIPHLCKTG